MESHSGVEAGVHAPADRRRLYTLALTALGVVYGDIGTSPLYAVRECFYGEHSVGVTQANILGVLSLIFWAIVLVVTVKYHLYVLRADNRGEGGILALTALVRHRVAGNTRRLVLVVGLFGAALLYADGILTPAISVLGAVEGLEVNNPAFRQLVVPISVVILIVLFVIQRRGTAGVGIVFGPVMLIWFATLAVLGVKGILMNPSVLSALNPAHAVEFFAHNGVRGYLVLGSVFLVATGGEALYADLGHFGEKPIQIDWFFLVGVSLLLNYFGQGALVLSNPEAAHNPFYNLAPEWGRIPLLILATMAAIIASQAIISGAFSLTRQAVQLGYLPRVNIVHTSATEIGQIYVPGINWALMIATLLVVVGFQHSSNVASAYGVALTTTMLITTLLAFVVTRRMWGWNLGLALAVTGAFLVADVAFFGATMIKVLDGGWFPLVMAGMVFLMMTTWRRGREILAERLQSGRLPFEVFVHELQTSNRIHRVPGIAVFMMGNMEGIPTSMLHHIKHNHSLHERVVLTTIVTEDVPYISVEEKFRFAELGAGLYRVVGRYGFMEDPNVPELLKQCAEHGLQIDPQMVSYYLGRETLIPGKKPAMALWRERLFVVMSRNASQATAFFRLPPNRVIEIGAQVEL